MANLYPVALVHGICGWGPKEINAGFISLPYWGYAVQDNLFEFSGNSQKVQGQKIIECSVGPFSSFHDRACELVAQIKGTRVDYGQAHADQFGHSRYGDDYTGKGEYPEWSESNPIHMVGHSMGAHTIMLAQYLLSIDYWGWGSNEKWVRSISTISAVLNGSTILYYLGCNRETGSADGVVASLLLGFINSFSIITNGLFNGIYDLDLGHWGMQRKSGESIKDFCRRLQRTTQFGANNDNAFYDLTIQGCYEMNKRVKTFPSTHYFSYVTEETHAGYFWWDKQYQFNDLDMSPVLKLLSGNFLGTLKDDYFVEPIPGWGSGDLQEAKWREHDGAVPSISQKYPWTAGNHPVGGSIKGTAAFAKGKWYTSKVQDLVGYSWDHLDICTTPASEGAPWVDAANKRFYKELYQRLAAL